MARSKRAASTDSRSGGGGVSLINSRSILAGTRSRSRSRTPSFNRISSQQSHRRKTIDGSSSSSSVNSGNSKKNKDSTIDDDSLLQLVDGSKHHAVIEKIGYLITGIHFLLGCYLNDYKRKRYLKYNKYIYEIISLSSIIYFMIVWYYVFEFLNKYYLAGSSPIIAIQQMHLLQRASIAVSYLLIDLVYPVSTVLILMILSNGTIKRMNDIFIDECGFDDFTKLKEKMEYLYQVHFVYCLSHVLVLLGWIHATYALWDAVFWSMIFGVPHVLFPVLLTVLLVRIFSLYNYCIEKFRCKFRNGSYKNSQEVWDHIIKIRNGILSLSNSLEVPLGTFMLILFLAITFQGIVVFYFNGEAFSLVYMVLNIWCLIWTLYGAQHTYALFNDAVDDIIHSSASSSVGNIDSSSRTNMIFALTQSTFAPRFKAFSFVSLSSETLITILLFCASSIISVLWETYLSKTVTSTVSKVIPAFIAES